MRRGRPQAGETPLTRFASSIHYADCWEWQGTRSPLGYGYLKVRGRPTLAHRFAYEQLVRPIPEHAEIDHLCRVRHCVNPDHLELVTHLENMQRSANQQRPIQTPDPQRYCKRLHWLDTTTAYQDSRGRIRCRPCHALLKQQRSVPV